MYRNMLTHLARWKGSPRRKPLLLLGARQTGKSWVLEEFGNRNFEHVIMADFEEETPAAMAVNASISANGLNPDKLLDAVGLDGKEKRADNTLIIFDEVQLQPRAFNALKYIGRKRPDVCVAASGSLMGLALKKGTRSPVGGVNVARMLPMTFYEFLEALGENDALGMLKGGRWGDYGRYAELLEKRVSEYAIVGGMPEPVRIFVETGDLDEVRNAQMEILDIYEQDFGKYRDDPEFTEKIRHAWKVACMLAAKENEDDVFFHKMPSKQASDYYAAVQWLEDCGLIHVCRRCSEPTGLLSGHIDLKRFNSFKVFVLDVGLRMAACGFPTNFFDMEASVQNGALKGKVFEQFAYQQLLASIKKPAGFSSQPIAYFSWKEKEKYEIDFMIPDGLGTVPVEVKGAKGFTQKSMAMFMEKHHPAKVLRITPRNAGINPPTWSLPLAGACSASDFLQLGRMPKPSLAAGLGQMKTANEEYDGREIKITTLGMATEGHKPAINASLQEPHPDQAPKKLDIL